MKKLWFLLLMILPFLVPLPVNAKTYCLTNPPGDCGHIGCGSCNYSESFDVVNNCYHWSCDPVCPSGPHDQCFSACSSCPDNNSISCQMIPTPSPACVYRPEGQKGDCHGSHSCYNGTTTCSGANQRVWWNRMIKVSGPSSCTDYDANCHCEDDPSCNNLTPTPTITPTLTLTPTPTPTPTSTPTPTPIPIIPSCTGLNLDSTEKAPGQLVVVSGYSVTNTGLRTLFYRKFAESVWTNWMFVGNSLNASQMSFVAPAAAGTYEVGMNVYSTDCRFVCGLTGGGKLDSVASCPTAGEWNVLAPAPTFPCVNTCRKTFTVVPDTTPTPTPTPTITAGCVFIRPDRPLETLRIGDRVNFTVSYSGIVEDVAFRITKNGSIIETRFQSTYLTAGSLTEYTFRSPGAYTFSVFVKQNGVWR